MSLITATTPLTEHFIQQGAKMYVSYVNLPVVGALIERRMCIEGFALLRSPAMNTLTNPCGSYLPSLYSAMPPIMTGLNPETVVDATARIVVIVWSVV